MNWASSEVVAVLAFLLPGFVAAAVFYSLTSFPRPGAFERVVSAFIFTMIAQTATEYGLSLVHAEEDAETVKEWKPLAPVAAAIALGLLAAVLSNTDILHKFLRKVRMTKETAYPSEWYSTFAQLGGGSCVVLHLPGERRLFGFAEEWPSDPNDGHFRITQPEWLDECGNRRRQLAYRRY